MFNLLKAECPNLTAARNLADEVSKLHKRTVYVVHICDDDYDVTSQVPERYEYRVSP